MLRTAISFCHQERWDCPPNPYSRQGVTPGASPRCSFTWEPRPTMRSNHFPLDFASTSG